MGTKTDQVLSIEMDSPFVRAIDTGDNIEKGGLPGTVGSDQSNNLTLGNTKGDIRQDRKTFEMFGYLY